ncbi:MAG: CerR family C-terminal domain-containing protein [Planctomycetota bacterium]
MVSTILPLASKKMDDSRSATADRLLDAAVEAFAESGYKGATVRDICQRAGASLNAVNYHFGDKQQLYVQAVKASHRRIRTAPGIDVVDQIAERFDGDPEQRLRAFVHGMVAMAMAVEQRTDACHQLMFREIGKPTIATEQIVREFIKPQFERLTHILQALLPPDADRLRIRLLALSVIGQCLHYKFAAPILPLLLSKSEQRQLTVERVAEHITGVVLAAVATPPESEAD